MKKIIPLLVISSIIFSILSIQPATTIAKSSKMVDTELVSAIGGLRQAAICGLAFVQFDAWMGVAIGLAGCSFGIGIAVGLAIGITGALIC